MKIKTSQNLKGRVEIYDLNGDLVWQNKNAVTIAGRSLVMDFLRTDGGTGLDDIIAIEDTTQEIIRKEAVNIHNVSDTETRYNFFLTEDDVPNETLEKLKLMANGATLTLDTGTSYAEVSPSIEKGPNQSLLIVWTVMT